MFTIHNIHAHLVDWQHGGCQNIPSTWWWSVPAHSTQRPLSRQVSFFPQQLTALCILQDLQREAIINVLLCRKCELLSSCLSRIYLLYTQRLHWAWCELWATRQPLRPLTKLSLQYRTQLLLTNYATVHVQRCKAIRYKSASGQWSRALFGLLCVKSRFKIEW